MALEKVIKANWLSRKPHVDAFNVAATLVVVLLVAAVAFFHNYLNSESWMPASQRLVFESGEYWRAWTTTLAHGDFGHLVSNLFLYTVFSFLLAAYYGPWFMPVLALFFGGVTNLVVLQSMPMDVRLIGMSGVVYWMGAVWITLYVLIENRESLKRKLTKSILIAAVLFFPERYDPTTSYAAHFVGFIFGVACGYLYFRLNYSAIKAAEVIEWVDVGEELSLNPTGEVVVGDAATSNNIEYNK